MKKFWLSIGHSGKPRIDNDLYGFFKKEIGKVVASINNETGIYWPQDAMFNKQWNERYGNALASLAALIFLGSENRHLLEVGDKLLEKILSYDNWNVAGHEDDDVNVLHLVLGVCYYVSLPDYNNKTLFNEAMVAIERILVKSLNNEKTEWYCSKTYIHNHCFHNLLLRYVCALTLYEARLMDGEIESECICLNTISNCRDRFKENFVLLKKTGSGITYEGASYTSYSVFSIIQYIFLDEIYFKETNLDGRDWLTWFPEAIHSLYIQQSHLSYSIADALYNWSYGPDFQIAFIGKYISHDRRTEDFASYLLKSRLSNSSNSSITRNNIFFWNLYLLGFMDSDGGVGFLDICYEYDRQASVINDLDLVRLSNPEWLIYHRGGIHGGRTFSKFIPRNIGHSYPSIGDVGIFYKGYPVIFGGLYAKPKKTEMWSTFQFFDKDGLLLGQDGDSYRKNGIITSDSPQFLDTQEYNTSPISIYKSGQVLLSCVLIKAYRFIGVTVWRTVTIVNEFCLIIDSIYCDNDKIKVVRSNFVNSLSRFSLSSDDSWFLFDDASQQSLKFKFSNRETKAIGLVNSKEKAHELVYNISRVYCDQYLSCSSLGNVLVIGKSESNAKLSYLNVSPSELSLNFRIDDNFSFSIHVSEVEDEKISLAVSGLSE